MAAKTSRVLRAVHRWLGVVLCLFMASWFASGIVLIYVPFPDLPRAERIAGSADIPLAEVRVSPTQALEHVSPKVTVEQIRLIAFGFRPAYVIHPRDGRVTAVWADSGGAARVTSGAAAKRLAEGFSGATALRVVGPFDTDQWVVHEKYTAFRPFYKVEMEGVDNTHLYVSQQSGEILQKTHGYERLWNYFGAVVHWIYPTFLRKNWVAWDQAVWWISLIGVIVTLIGIWLGIDAMRIARRGRRERSSLFSGWMRLHHILGIFSGVFVFCWIFSGWLSMDHGRLFSTPNPSNASIDAFRGIDIAAASRSVNVSFLQSLAAAREVSIGAIAEEPIVVLAGPDFTRIFSPTEQRLHDIPSIPAFFILLAAKKAWPDNEILSSIYVHEDDTYTSLRGAGLSPDAVRLSLDDKHATWVHIDAANGNILSVMDRGRRLYRWLYNGMHSLDIPGLVNRRPLWDVTILALLFLGFAFSITGVVVGFQRIQRQLD